MIFASLNFYFLDAYSELWNVRSLPVSSPMFSFTEKKNNKKVTTLHPEPCRPKLRYLFSMLNIQYTLPMYFVTPRPETKIFVHRHNISMGFSPRITRTKKTRFRKRCSRRPRTVHTSKHHTKLRYSNSFMDIKPTVTSLPSYIHQRCTYKIARFNR